MNNCWLISKKIICPACKYPYGESPRYIDTKEWLKEQLRVLYFADPEFAGESLYRAEENILDYIAAQDRRFFLSTVPLE